MHSQDIKILCVWLCTSALQEETRTIRIVVLFLLNLTLETLARKFDTHRSSVRIVSDDCTAQNDMVHLPSFASGYRKEICLGGLSVCTIGEHSSSKN